MCQGLSNDVSTIIFWFLVKNIQSDEITTFSYIFSHFRYLMKNTNNASKMTENVVTSSSWIFMTKHQKIIIHTAFESPRRILFKKIWSTLSQHDWSLLFQKGTQLACFAIFSVFCDSRSQYWSYDYIVYIFSHLQDIPQLLLGTDFLFDV